jgi:hypothetical protein
VHGSRTGRSATLALRDGRGGLVVFCHAGCTSADIFAELRRRGLIGDNENRRHQLQSTPVPPEVIEQARRHRLARRIWDGCEGANDTAAAAYFLWRGLDISRLHSLRYAPSLRRMDGSYGPAVVARVDDVDGRFIGIHRAWIAPDRDGSWRRRDRAGLGPIRGGSVRLAPASATLLVGEGIETTASAMQATGLPGWAALSTSGLVTLALPELVEHIIIVADHDTNGAGERAAQTAAQRWLAESRSVKIAMPPHPDTDFNDLLLGRFPLLNEENLHA